MVRPLKIQFTGPYGLLGNHESILFDDPIGKCSGIYIWTAQMNDAFVIEYIGITTVSFAKRSMEHIINTFGGNYRICDSDKMKKAQEEILWPGFYRKKRAIAEFSEIYLDLAPSILNYLQTIKVFTATVGLERRVVERIEGALARYVWNQPQPASALLPKDVRYRKRKEDEEPIRVEIQCDREILGIPTEIEV